MGGCLPARASVSVPLIDARPAAEQRADLGVGLQPTRCRSDSANLAYLRINLRSRCLSDMWNLASHCGCQLSEAAAREVNEEAG